MALNAEIDRLRAELKIATKLILPTQAQRIVELEAANAAQAARLSDFETALANFPSWGAGDYELGWQDAAQWIRQFVHDKAAARRRSDEEGDALAGKEE